MQGPALSTVTGTTCPSGRNTCVIPIFFPKIPGLINSPGVSSQESESRRILASRHSDSWLLTPRRFTSLPLPKRLDLDVHASRQIQFHQRIHGVLGRLENIEQALVRTDLKLLPAFFVHVRRAQHRV